MGLDDDDDSGFALIGLMLGYRDDKLGGIIGLFESFAEDGKRDGRNNGTVLGLCETEGTSMEGSNVGSGEGSIVGHWVNGVDVGPTD